MSAFDDATINTNYAIHGADAVVTLADNTVVEGGLRVIDETIGQFARGFQVGVNTVEPSCCVRMTELAEKDLEPEDLRGCQVEFLSHTWTSRTNRLRPTLGGIDAGELVLVLITVS